MSRRLYFISALNIFFVVGLAYGAEETTLTDRDGNQYKTVAIGHQRWMATNLKTTRFRDGTPIRHITDYATWAKTVDAAYSEYDNDPKIGAVYGKLYNFYAIVESRGLCPIGWHVPSDDEWRVLIDHLGGMKAAGGQLKTTGKMHWRDNVGATNGSGFGALPGGHRYTDSFDEKGNYVQFNWLGRKAWFWTSTKSTHPGASWFWSLSDINTHVEHDHWGNGVGFSCRCIRD